MKRILAAVLGIALAFCGIGCLDNQYRVSWVAQEHVKGKIDAQWFARTINHKGELKAIEMIYCPSVPGKPTVCRTAVVWEKNASALVPGDK